MNIIDSEGKYNKLFRGPSQSDTKLLKAFEKAHEIRIFEIELYWKRATYFWAFIAATFAGYFAIYSSVNTPQNDILFLLNCLGIVFSFSFYLVNRVSKYWQLNWEKHVDMLEDEISGPLYKTTIDPSNYKLHNLIGPLSLSPTKINEISSLFVFFMWIFLFIRSISYVFDWEECFKGFNIIVLSLSTVITLLLLYCSTGSGIKKKEDKILFIKRNMPL
jgi:hypothetical protein